jgi:inner membrane protein
VFSDIATRTITELGPWIWMIAGFMLMATQVFLSGYFMLAGALAALATGTVAVMGASGVIYQTSFEQQSGVFVLIFLCVLALIGSRQKKRLV